MLPTGVTKLDNKPTPDADRFLSLPPGGASELAGVEIFGQTSKYPRVECRSMGVGIGLKKVKFSHTRYRALGPELIPVYRQSARR